jgi:hypothetical protein
VRDLAHASVEFATFLEFAALLVALVASVIRFLAKNLPACPTADDEAHSRGASIRGFWRKRHRPLLLRMF